MKKLLFMLIALFTIAQPTISVASDTISRADFIEIENQAGLTLSSYDGDDDDNYDGIGDHELEDMESGFRGAELDTRKVLSFTFNNDNTTEEAFYIAPGFRNLDINGAPKDGVAKNGNFKAIGGLKDLSCTGNSTCTIDELRDYFMKYPMRCLGFEVRANSKDAVSLPMQGVNQIKTTQLTFVRQHPMGDGSPEVIKPGISVKGGQFHQDQSSSDANFQFDFQNQIKLNLLGKCSITFDFYIGAIQNSSVTLARKHVKARSNR
jgi:hypothetical protein